MAIVATKNPSGLKIKFDCGKDDITGKTITKSRTYSNVRPSATNDAVYQAANAIGSLQIYDVMEVAKIDNTTLSE